MDNLLLSVFVAILLAVGLSIVVILPGYIQVAKEQSDAAAAALANGEGKGKAPPKFTREDVAKHRSETDCWLIVKDKVYDVTEYVDEHPGGEAILKNAGGENTTGFYGPQHPRFVYEQIDQYYVGDLVKNVKQI